MAAEGISMRTIVLATQKGGSGKSTLTIGLALAAQQAGHNVRLIDTDPQATLSSWQCRRGLVEPLVEPIYIADDLDQRLLALERGGVTLTIVDTASGMSKATIAAIRYADLCLVPARLCVADIEATKPTLSLVRTWNKPFAFVLNQTPVRGQRITIASSALGEVSLDVADVLAQPFIVMRNDHQDALGAGLAVSEYAPLGKSAEEVRDLWQWVEARLNRAPTADERLGDRSQAAVMPATASPNRTARTTAMLPALAWGEAGAPWDSCL
jgi:chromosome partitioning protein